MAENKVDQITNLYFTLLLQFSSCESLLLSLLFSRVPLPSLPYVALFTQTSWYAAIKLSFASLH